MGALPASPVPSPWPRARGRVADVGLGRPLLLAAAIPLLFLHVRYQPVLHVGAGDTTVDVALSDFAVLAVALGALASAATRGWSPLARGVPVWLAAGGFLALVLVSISYPPLRDEPYDWQARLVSALKLCEYAVLALATPLLVASRREATIVVRALVAWSAAATAWGVLQFAGAVNEFEGKRPGQREPSFVGIHDFAALSGAALVLGVVALACREDVLGGRGWRLLAIVVGGLGIVLSGAMTAVLGLWLAALALLLAARRRRRLTRAATATVVTLALLVSAGTALMRGSTLEHFAAFLGLEQETTTGVQSYAHRTLLAYIGVRIWLDRPLTGVGYQGSSDVWAFGPHLADAHRRFPHEPEQAFPSRTRPWGVQNLYVETLADLGLIGFALLLALFAAAVRAALRAGPGSALPLVGLGWLLLAAGVWNGIGLVPGIPLAALTWLALGLVTARA